MIDLGYDLIKNIFDDLTGNNSFFWFQSGLKLLAVGFFLLTFFSNILTARVDWGEAKLPFDRSKLINALIVILLIASYDKILGLLDGLLSPLDAQINKYSPLHHELFNNEIDKGQEDIGAMAYLKKAAALVIETIQNPFSLVVKLCYLIFWIFDNLVYGFFLVERFFFLTVLKILGPVAFTMSVFERFRGLLYKWFQLYVAYYLLILPFFLVIYVTNEIFTHLSQSIEGDPLLSLMPSFKTMPYAVIMGLSFFLKFKLFKKSSDIVYKIFT